MAMVTVDGGRGFWNPHPGDDAGAMVVDELVPMCRRLGLGRAPARVGIMGISMGGYGAILLAERHRRLFSAVAAISPAIFEDFHVAQSMFPSAFASDASFQATDVITHVSQLAGLPVLISSGQGDPFHPGVAALARVLPRSAQVHFPVGCHTRTFFAEQVMPSLLFMGSHIGRSESRTRQA